MSKDINKCIFIGRLGKDPETQSGACKFSIACSDDYTDKQGQKVERTNWVNIVAFGKLGETCQRYLNKGSQVYLEGKFTTNKWQDNNGNDRYSTEIIANEMQMLGSKGDNKGGQAQNNKPQQNNQPPQQFDDFDDDIAF